MSDTCCTALTATGQPCRAHPRPGRSVCALHDPELADTIADGRSKGGAAPRRVRRYPRLLDHLHVAELLGELFIAALNDPERFDTKRLQVLTNLARVLLKAVGVPRTPEEPGDRSEPPPKSDHLLRIYPPLAPEVEALLAADLLAAPTPEPLNPSAADESSPGPSPAEEPVPLDEIRALLDVLSWLMTQTAPSDSSTPASPPAAISAPPSQPEQVPEQVLDRCATGLPALEATPVLSPPDSPVPFEPALAPANPPGPAKPPNASPDPAEAGPAQPTVRYYPAWPAGSSAPIGSPFR
jgi:hypothetical protein